MGSSDGGSLDRPEMLGLLRALDPERPLGLLHPKGILGEGFAFTSAAGAAIGALALAGGPAAGADGVPPGIPGLPGSLAPPDNEKKFEMPPAWHILNTWGGTEGGRAFEGGPCVLVLSTTRRGGACAVLLGAAIEGHGGG